MYIVIVGVLNNRKYTSIIDLRLFVVLDDVGSDGRINNRPIINITEQHAMAKNGACHDIAAK